MLVSAMFRNLLSFLVQSIFFASRVKHLPYIGGVNLLCLLVQNKTYVACFTCVLVGCNPVARYHSVPDHCWAGFLKGRSKWSECSNCVWVFALTSFNRLLAVGSDQHSSVEVFP